MDRLYLRSNRRDEIYIMPQDGMSKDKDKDKENERQITSG
jgi:hypothetical protein